MNSDDNELHGNEPEKARWRLWHFFGPVFILIGIVFGWRYAVPTGVTVTRAKPATLNAELFAPGIVDAVSRVQLSPRISGRIIELCAEPGDPVADGEPLVRMQSDSADALLCQVQAQLASARAQLAAARADLDSAAATAERAARDHLRLETLAEKQPDAVAQSDLDLSTATLATAQAGESGARARCRAAESSVSAAEAAVAYQQAQQADNVLAAPFAGIITQRIRSIGDTVGPESGILELVDPATLFIQARFDESLFFALSLNAPARAVFHGTETNGIPGHVARIDRVVDGETREFIAEITLDSLPPHWALGRRTDVYVEARVPVAAALPRHYVRWNDRGAYVWIVHRHRAVRRPVTIGLTTDDAMQIVSGLGADDFVINPDIRLYPGRRVHPAEKNDAL